MMLDPEETVRRGTSFGPSCVISFFARASLLSCSGVGGGAVAEALYMVPCATGDEDRLSLLTIPTVHIQLRAAVCRLSMRGLSIMKE
jgi:hypothetical protein